MSPAQGESPKKSKRSTTPKRDGSKSKDVRESRTSKRSKKSKRGSNSRHSSTGERFRDSTGKYTSRQKFDAAAKRAKKTGKPFLWKKELVLTKEERHRTVDSGAKILEGGNKANSADETHDFAFGAIDSLRSQQGSKAIDGAVGSYPRRVTITAEVQSEEYGKVIHRKTLRRTIEADNAKDVSDAYADMVREWVDDLASDDDNYGSTILVSAVSVS
jgi:hypothetical protein